VTQPSILSYNFKSILLKTFYNEPKKGSPKTTPRTYPKTSPVMKGAFLTPRSFTVFLKVDMGTLYMLPIESKKELKLF